MWSIFKKEINQYFSSLTGYIAIILFLLVSGVFLFILEESSILEYGYATMDRFFEIAPWLLLFIIPAISMRSFSDEYKSGTVEILLTKPLRKKDIVFGKYFSILIICLFLITPTFLYVFTIHRLSANGNIDGGGIMGSYFGLFLLCATFASVSMFCSSLTTNAIVAFLLSAFISLILYTGFDALSKLAILKGNLDYYLEMFGLDFHYRSMSRGVIDTRDVIYFFSIILFSLLITEKQMQKK